MSGASAARLAAQHELDRAEVSCLHDDVFFTDDARLQRNIDLLDAALLISDALSGAQEPCRQQIR